MLNAAGANRTAHQERRRAALATPKVNGIHETRSRDWSMKEQTRPAASGRRIASMRSGDLQAGVVRPVAFIVLPMSMSASFRAPWVSSVHAPCEEWSLPLTRLMAPAIRKNGVMPVMPELALSTVPAMYRSRSCE